MVWIRGGDYDAVGRAGGWECEAAGGDGVD